MSGLGVALGPVIGGGITEYSSWQWIFWINVPIGLLLLPVVALVRESRGGAGRLDPIGVTLVTTGLFGIVFGLVRGNSHGWTSGQVLGGADRRRGAGARPSWPGRPGPAPRWCRWHCSAAAGSAWSTRSRW